LTRYAWSALAALPCFLVASPALAGGGPIYDLLTDALDPQACGAGCWTNHLRVADIDGDDDLDIILANYPDFFNGNTTGEPLVIYANDGSAGFTNVSATAVDSHVGALRQIALGDIDGDGDLDMFGPSGGGLAYVLFVNDGAGVFTEEASTRLPPEPYPQGAAARMADVDNDGDLDIFSADGYASAGPPFGHLYINDGTGTFTEAAGAIPDAITGVDIDDCEFFDADRDFDLDLIVNAHSGGTGGLWLNDGTGVFTAGGSVAPPATANFHYNVAPCDVDADGDLDLWIDNIGGNFTEQLLINDGTGTFADETGARVTGNPSADDNGVVCADIDNDGDMDGVVMSLSSAERFLQNDGTGNFTFVNGAFPAPTNCTLWGEFGDFDADGRIDLVTGQGECSSSDEVYIANEGVPVDSLPPVIVTSEPVTEVELGTDAVIRYAVSDRTITDEGPQLASAHAILDPDGAATEVPAVAMGGDLFRVVLPGDTEGTITYQVCAIDPAGNTGCSENLTYDVTTVSASTGDSTGEPADSTGAPQDTGVDETADGPMTGGPMTSADGSGSSGSVDTDTDPGNDDDGAGGCGCRQGGNGAAYGWLLLGALGFVSRRRRRD
jgi:MYXO-CTERM domain-containing protein